MADKIHVGRIILSVANEEAFVILSVRKPRDVIAKRRQASVSLSLSLSRARNAICFYSRGTYGSLKGLNIQVPMHREQAAARRIEQYISKTTSHAGRNYRATRDKGARTSPRSVIT